MLFCLAPMDGYTDLAMRYITDKIFQRHNHSDKMMFFSEFMSADGYIANPSGVDRHILHLDGESLVMQIFGGKEDNLIKCAQNLDSKYDFKYIELNIGCPSPKIMACGGGSHLLKDKKRTLEIIRNLKDSINTPFSIKTRSGINDSDKKAQFDFILEAAEYIDMITIHGRTWTKGHSGDVDRNFIYQAKDLANPRCKIIGNGGIKTFEEAKNRVKNLDGVMIGSASMGNPWIFGGVKPSKEELIETILLHLDLLAGVEIYHRNLGDQRNLVIKNINELIELANKNPEQVTKTPIEFRKHLWGYIKGIIGTKSWKQDIIMTKDYIGLRQKIIDFQA